DIHGARLRHAVVTRPGAVVLVPLPDVTLERRFGVDLELVDVDAFAEQLLQRLDQTRMMRPQPKGFGVGMGGESGARRARFLAPNLLAIGPKDPVGLAAQKRDLLLGEAIWKKEVALLFEGFDLLRCETHGVLPGTTFHGSSLAGSASGITCF